MKGKGLHPYMIIIISFVAVIAVGTALLALPIATTSDGSLGFVDSLFMATSAVCVTGLSVVNLSVDFTVFGKIVMALLMEIGGLSFITIAVFFFTVLGAKIGFSNRLLLRESLNQSSLKGIVSLVKRIILISAIVQIVGALINLIPLMNTYHDFWKAFGIALFHSAASFNNAGFDIFGDRSMIDYSDNLILNATTMTMIVLGGIGFVVIDEIIRKHSWSKFSLHTKMTIVSTLFLILIGTLLLKGAVSDRSVVDAATNTTTTVKGMTWLEALFTSISCRTAGFATYDMANLSYSPAGYIVCILLMFIGASPCSTGGGVKTTTIAVVILAVVSFARGKKTKVFNRKISDSNLFKAFVLISVGVAIDVAGALIIAAIQPELNLSAVVFEVVSAFSTTGLSMGITGDLNVGSRLIVCLIMLLGRLGPLTVIGVVNKNWMVSSNDKIQYVEENVIIG